MSQTALGRRRCTTPHLAVTWMRRLSTNSAVRTEILPNSFGLPGAPALGVLRPVCLGANQVVSVFQFGLPWL